jgi:hypothetical protein
MVQERRRVLCSEEDFVRKREEYDQRVLDIKL